MSQAPEFSQGPPKTDWGALLIGAYLVLPAAVYFAGILLSAVQGCAGTHVAALFGPLIAFSFASALWWTQRCRPPRPWVTVLVSVTAAAMGTVVGAVAWLLDNFERCV